MTSVRHLSDCVIVIQLCQDEIGRVTGGNVLFPEVKELSAQDAFRIFEKSVGVRYLTFLRGPWWITQIENRNDHRQQIPRIHQNALGEQYESLITEISYFWRELEPKRYIFIVNEKFRPIAPDFHPGYVSHLADGVTGGHGEDAL